MDVFMSVFYVGILLILGLVLFVAHRSRKVSSISEDNIVIFHQTPVTKIWSGSSVNQFDDKGDLKIDRDGIKFKGVQENINISRDDIKHISSYRAQSPWKVFILIDSILIILFVYFLQQQSFAALMVFISLVVLNGIFLVMATGAEWIKISYKDKTIYLGQGYPRGLPTMQPAGSGIFGGNYELYRKIKNILKS